MEQLAIAIAMAFIVAGCFALGFFCALKAVRMGLKWQTQADVGAKPTTDREDKDAQAEETLVSAFTPDLMREYLTGKPSIPQKDDEK